MINIGVIGAGYWGPNLIRTFNQLKDCKLKTVCDLNETNLRKISAQYPVKTLKDFKKLVKDPKIDAVAIVTPPATHYEIAKEALLNNKHVFIEKPFVLDISHANELISLAKGKKRIIMLNHILQYHPAVKKLENYIRKGELGRVYYIYSRRVNLGKIRTEENSLWSFAPHDISVILHLLKMEPTSVNARGQSYLNKDVEDVVFLTLHFRNKIMAHIHVSWLDPHKIRELVIVGSKKMAVFDDTKAAEKIRLYDKGVDYSGEYKTYAESLSLRIGDINIPKIEMSEPLKNSCQHFLDCIKENKKPLSDGESGLMVLKILDAAQKSLKLNGKSIDIK